MAIIFNDLVNIMKGIFLGSIAQKEAIQRVNEAVDHYTSSIVDLGAALGIELLQHTRELQKSVFDIAGHIGELSLSSETHFQVLESQGQEISIGVRKLLQGSKSKCSAHQADLSIDSRKQNKGEWLLNWLSPSHWLVEGQLQAARSQRFEGTLQWALAMPEFMNWQISQFGASESVLWIRGGPGVGKSTMAAYLIDIIKSCYQSSIVAYFFCKSERPGLNTARDIVRTLSYQCIYNNEEAQSALEILMTTNFPRDTVGIRLFFSKLLLEPLQRIGQDIHIILDGLDEVDFAIDAEEQRAEIHVLINCLAHLPCTRLLFLSRPETAVNVIIPGLTIKHVDFSHNGNDIQKYVVEEIARSESFQRWFPPELGDPVTYFVENSNGVFLWAALLLRQLSRARSKLVFQNCLDGVSEGSGMDVLYSGILSRIDRNDIKWIKEILLWLAVAEGELDVDELQAAVESSQKDEINDFTTFLDEECGSIVYLIPKWLRWSVQLIHETLRSFLLDPHKCPPQFYI